MQQERLGPYKIGEQIGKGGMGAVYRAVHVETGEIAAVKALAPHLGMAEGFRERFEAEIESLKKLRHECIVRLYGYGEQDDVLFYAMELVDGTSLEEEISAGRRFNWREVAQISVQVCRALKHAHDHGVIHRDIKPANLLIDSLDNIKIADFGIARLFGGTQLTSVGGVLGTADYMSPEQADGRAVTEKCDQYSLGGVIYALLGGRPPFRAKNLPEMLQMQRFAEPEPVRRYAPDTPVQFEQVVGQLLSKSPDDRFPNVLVLRRHLEAMLKALGRPVKNDFELAADRACSGAAASSDDFNGSVALDTTRIEPAVPQLSTRQGDSAATAGREPLDSSEVDRGEKSDRTNALTGPVTHQIAAEEEFELEKSVDLAPPGEEDEQAESARLAPRTRFTTVEEDALRNRQREGPPLLVQIARALSLIGAIAAISWIAFYLTRPPTSDDLYLQITENGGPERSENFRSLEQKEQKADEFLNRFSEDHRAPEIAGYKESIETAMMERRLNKIADRGGGERNLLPVEQMYIDAVRLAGANPREAIRRLEAILSLYGAANNEGADGETGGGDPDAAVSEPVDPTAARVRSCLKLVDHRLVEYQRQEESRAENHLSELDERLRIADEVSETDPAAACEIYRAIIALYSDTPWAAEAVERAQAGLARIEE